jgi:hypothetical protein
MAAPLNTCTTIEQRGFVRFSWAKNMKAKDIHYIFNITAFGFNYHVYFSCITSYFMQFVS